MTPQELRSSILQLAIQGKLVEQRDEEGTAEELYQQIQAEKRRLIKEGKIKKEKPLPEILEDQIPFDIPETWKWVRLVELGAFSSGKTPNMAETRFWTNGTIQWFTSKDMKKKYLDESEMKITELAAEGMTHYPTGTLLMVVRSGILKRMLPVCILTCEATINQDLKAYRLFDLRMSDYVYYMLKGFEPIILNDYTKRVTTVDSLKFDEFSKEMLVPLPPFAEQKRIVAKIEELLPYIDRYEQAWTKLEDFNKRFPVDMQRSILQMAIQGKLVEQRSEEGTGEELYQQIQAEKQKLIKEGKIKKEKPLPEITADDMPFDIPEGWKWVRLRDISTKVTDGTHHSPPNVEIGEYKYVTAKNIKDHGISLSNITYVTEAVHQEIYSRCNPELGDVLLIKDGATTGVVTVNNLDEQFSLLSSVALIKIPESLCAWYLVYVLRSDLFYKAVRAQMKGTGITRITLKQIEPMVIPLPPLAEQKRIVARLEELLPQCEKLK